jgi:hypothetical protein
VRVTDRGEVVADLTAPGGAPPDGSVAPGLAALARRGLVTLGAPADERVYLSLPRSRRRSRTAAQLLDEERAER